MRDALSEDAFQEIRRRAQRRSEVEPPVVTKDGQTTIGAAELGQIIADRDALLAEVERIRSRHSHELIT